MFSLTEPVHRLVDMVVEEVSLVDRAANKRRFLIVKRDEAMKDDNKEEGSVTKGSPALGVAVSALDGLTKIVELLGQLGIDNVDSRVAELAVQLRTTTEQLLARLTGAEEPASETPEDKKKSEEVSLAEHIEATKQAITQLAELATKVEVPAAPSTPEVEPTSPPEPIPAEPPGEDAIAKLTQQFEGLLNMVKDQQQRLGRVEKNYGIPNSNPAPEQISKSAPNEVSWPLDLNNFKDRESVDKSVSFHDL